MLLTGLEPISKSKGLFFLKLLVYLCFGFGFGSSGIVFNCAHFQSIRALQYFTDVLLTFFLFINALQLSPD